jgi:hypothetical protein
MTRCPFLRHFDCGAIDFGPLVLSEAFFVLKTTVVQNVAENRFLPTFTYLFAERVNKLATAGQKPEKNLAMRYFTTKIGAIHYLRTS